jgi:hypothetical protein
MVSPQPLHDLGMLAEGLSEKRSKNLPGATVEARISKVQFSKFYIWSEIRVEWNRFYKPFIVEGTAPTKAQLLQKATEIDLRYGPTFNPPLEGGK